MSEQRLQVQVGIVFILAVILLISGVMWFKDFKIGGSTYEIKVDFPTTSGLVKGDPVEVAGVVSGKVSEIDYRKGHAEVTLRLDNGVALYSGTKAVLENVGIMGQKMVALYPGPGSNPPIPAGATLDGSYQPGIPQLMAGLGGTLDTFDELATRLDSLLAKFDDRQQEQLLHTLNNTEALTGEMADLLKQNRQQFHQSIKDFSSTVAELNKALSGRGEELGLLIDNTSKASARLDSTLLSLDRTTGRFEELIERVESGDGTAGKLLSDEELYNELVATLRQAQDLLADVKKNPRRYFKVSIF